MSSETDRHESEPSTAIFDRWRSQADENIEEWGLQDEETLLLAIQEELGELTQAHLEANHEDGDRARVDDELDDLGALLLQLHERRQREMITDGGRPRDGGAHKYTTSNREETSQEWTSQERRVLFSWTCKPFVDVHHRFDSVECRFVVEFDPEVGLDVVLEARSTDTGKVPDDWTAMISIEGRDGIAHYRRKTEARWVE